MSPMITTGLPTIAAWRYDNRKGDISGIQQIERSCMV